MRRVKPIPPEVPLHLVGSLLRPGQVTGAWVGCSPGARGRSVYRSARLLISADLGSLLVRTERVVAWDGARLRTLPVGDCRTG
jgi:hypothetical protein